MKHHITIDDTGEIFIEWIHPLLRFGITLTPGKIGWFCISKTFEIMENGEFDLPTVEHVDTELTPDTKEKLK